MRRRKRGIWKRREDVKEGKNCIAILVQEGEKGQVRDSEGREGELFPFTRIRQRTIGKLRCSFPLLFLLIVSPLYKREFVISWLCLNWKRTRILGYGAVVPVSKWIFKAFSEIAEFSQRSPWLRTEREMKGDGGATRTRRGGCWGWRGMNHGGSIQHLIFSHPEPSKRSILVFNWVLYTHALANVARFMHQKQYQCLAFTSLLFTLYPVLLKSGVWT